LASMEAAHYKLVLNDADSTKQAIESSEKILDSMPSVDPVTHAGFYRVCADYYKVCRVLALIRKAKADYAQYYKHALLFLACVQLEELSVHERTERAYDLSISALLADSLYNFGELLMHPVLDSLKGTKNEWLRLLLFAFNSGEIGKFDALSSNFNQQPLLAQSMSFLREKLCIMALIELVFKRPGDKRRIPFDVVAKETRFIFKGYLLLDCHMMRLKFL
jgi:26S proteasome regulatory subunit N9